MRESLNTVRVKNVSGEKIPPFAVMVISGIERLDDDAPVLKVEKYADPPTVEGQVRLLINSSQEIGTSGSQQYGWGRVPWATSGWVRYNTSDSAGAPEFGDEWGPEDDSWAIGSTGTGFHILGLNSSVNSKTMATTPAGDSVDCPNNFRFIVVGNPTAGSFDLSLELPDGSDDLTLHWDDTAAEVASVIESHIHWKSGYTVEAADGPFPMHSISVQLGGDLSTIVVAIPTVSNITLSGGARTGVRIERACCEET